MRIWSLPGGVALWDTRCASDAEAVNVAYDASGKRLACACADGIVTVYSTEALSELDDDDFADAERRARYAAYASPLRDAELLQKWCAVEHGPGLLASALSGDGTRIATGGEDGAVYIWDVQETSRHELEHFQAAGPVVAVAFLPEDPFLITGLRSGQVHLWDIARAVTG